MRSFAAIALLGAVYGQTDFPDCDFLHADCSFDVAFPFATCKDVYTRIYSIANEFLPGPANGTYSIHDAVEGDYVWATRTTPVSKYVDDILFKFEESDNDCIIHGKSRSQSLSIYDYDTNYCNLWNVITETGYHGEVKIDSCWFYPDTPKETCSKY